jgi:hypothetical protein
LWAIGRVAISVAPTGPIAVRLGEELVVIGGGGTTLVVLDEPSQPFGAGRRLQVKAERASPTGGPGTALLMAKGMVLGSWVPQNRQHFRAQAVSIS